MSDEGNHKFPSITTVLGIKDTDWLENWKASVGEDRAHAISSQASQTGTQIHHLCEMHLKNSVPTFTSELMRAKWLSQQTPKIDNHVFNRFVRMKPILSRINNIQLQEIPLGSLKLRVAGTPDCIGEFDGELAVIDFKTSQHPKKSEWIRNYFIQETAYCIMFFEMFGVKIGKIVTLISCMHGEDQIFIQHPRYFVDELKSTMIDYYEAIHGR